MAREGTFLGTLRKTNNNKSTHRVDSGVFSALGPHHPQQASGNVAAPTSTSPSWRPVILIPNITSSPRTTRGWELKPDPAAFAGAHMPWGLSGGLAQWVKQRLGMGRVEVEHKPELGGDC